MTTLHLTADILARCTGLTVPKTIRRHLRTAGFSDSDAAALAEAVSAAKAIRAARQNRRPGIDPLIAAALARTYLAARLRRRRAIEATPIFRAWRADFSSRVLAQSDCGLSVDHEARLATLEAIAREARRRGWTVRNSVGSTRRASSRYITIPGVGTARVSDHGLPQTAKREADRAVGIRGRWRGEVIVRDWRVLRLEAYMRRVLLAAAGRYCDSSW